MDDPRVQQAFNAIADRARASDSNADASTAPTAVGYINALQSLVAELQVRVEDLERRA